MFLTATMILYIEAAAAAAVAVTTMMFAFALVSVLLCSGDYLLLFPYSMWYLCWIAVHSLYFLHCLS